MQITMAWSCVAYGTSSPTASGPVFNAADRLEEAIRRSTDGWFEQSGIVAFTWLGPKR